MFENKNLKTTEVQVNLQTGKELTKAVSEQLSLLPEGSQNIQVCLRYPIWIKQVPSNIVVNGISYPTVITRKDIPKMETAVVEIWLEFDQCSPGFLNFV